MIDLTRDRFLAFCLSKGQEKYDPLDVWNCAFSQFVRSEIPETRSTTVDFDTGEVIGIGQTWNNIAKLVLDDAEIETVMQTGQTFADIVDAFEGAN